MLDFLPDNLKESLKFINLNFVYEIRIRENMPVCINYGGNYRFLGVNGVTERIEKALYCTKEEIESCIFRAGKYSVYSVEEQIKKGFITAENGERIGLAGEYVQEKGQTIAIRNFSSICIRVPHEVIGCGMEIYKRYMYDKVRSILIMSSPGQGKTTILRDLARLISKNTRKNILICDERGEISAGNVGASCDILKYSDKATAFESGIRAMRPDLIITDELSEEDCKAVKKALNAGIEILASAHFSSTKYVKTPFLGLFQRYVLLDEFEIGKINGIYDSEGKEIVYD